MTKNDDAMKMNNEEPDQRVLEYQRLLACYQIASRDDKNVVWAALNKYMPSLAL